MNHKIGLSAAEKKALEELKRRFRDKFGGNFVEIKLFGSRARNDMREGSDIDILAIFKDRTREVEEKLVDILCEIVTESGVYFEVVSYSRDEYKSARRQQWPFILNIEREAILI
jgi:predicted nucleotidyltransferase